jgi:hypothetical protein
LVTFIRKFSAGHILSRAASVFDRTCYADLRCGFDAVFFAGASFAGFLPSIGISISYWPDAASCAETYFGQSEPSLDHPDIQVCLSCMA